MKNIRLYISCPFKCSLSETDIIKPIQVGTVIADERCENIQGDDTGENISDLHAYFGDLTAHYWVWKNYDSIGNPEYIGFMKHDRHFVFKENFFDFGTDSNTLSGYSYFPYVAIDSTYKEKIGLDDSVIAGVLSKSDAVFVKKSFTRAVGAKSYKRLLFKEHKKIRDTYDICRQIILENYPEYEKYVNMLENGSYAYRYNMFVLKKELFFEYCQLVFPVLQELYQQTNYPDQYLETYKALGEFLYSLFVIKTYKSKCYAVKELYTTFVQIPCAEEPVQPVWTDNKNAIAVGCSNLYAPYLAAYIQSICENSTLTNKYDIVVLNDDITRLNKNKLEKVTSGYDNVSLRFCDVSSLFGNASLYISHAYFSKHCYYRLSIGKLFEKYEKVLYTDIDIAINFDVAEAFTLNMQNNPIAACEEVLWTHTNRKGRIQFGKCIEDYITIELGCTDKYFNTGFMLVDIEKFNQVASFEVLLQTASENNFINQEQCVLNKVFNEKISLLPPTYNFEIYSGVFDSPLPHFRVYMKQLENAKVYHYLTDKKAWFCPELPKADIWWKFARKTPFYEEILQRLAEKNSDSDKSTPIDYGAQLRQEFIATHFPNINNRFSSNEYKTKLLYALSHMWYFRFMKLRYAICKAFSFGKKNSKYAFKYEASKKLLKDARRFRKQMKTL